MGLHSNPGMHLVLGVFLVRLLFEFGFSGVFVLLGVFLCVCFTLFPFNSNSDTTGVNNPRVKYTLKDKKNL